MPDGIDSTAAGGGPASPPDAAESSATPQPAWLDEMRAFFTAARLTKIAILAGLFCWLFHQHLLRLLDVWLGFLRTPPQYEDWSHGCVIPFFAVGIFVYIRDRWKNVKLNPTYWGLAVVFAALLMDVWATWWSRLIMFQDYSWWLLLVGLIVTLCGRRFTAAIWFPLLFIGFGIRISDLLYYTLATWLQQKAAICSTGLLNAFGVWAERSGVTITLFSRSHLEKNLEVAEACSGMHIIMAFAALGSLIAYLVRRPWWHRWALVAAILPVAIAVNVVRVVGMGLANYFDHAELVTGDLVLPLGIVIDKHAGMGMFMLPLAFLLFWLLHVLLCHLVVEDKGGKKSEDAGSANLPNPRLADRPSVGAGTVYDSAPPAPIFDRAAEQKGPHDDRGFAALWQSARRLGLFEHHFLALAGVMLALAVSWNVVLGLTGSFFLKQPVPLRQALDRFPRELPGADGTRWKAMTSPPPASDELLPKETETSLSATSPYRLRGDKSVWAVNSKGEPAIDPTVADDARLLETPQYVQRFYQQFTSNGAAVSRRRAYFFVSYYTGTPDPVPHVPERCYKGAGWEELKSEDRVVTVPGLTEPIPLRCTQFARESQITNVVYFLHANGRRWSDHSKVRLALNSPLGKYSYFAKVEVTFGDIQDLDEAAAAAAELLGDFLPTLERDFLPDWSKYNK